MARVHRVHATWQCGQVPYPGVFRSIVNRPFFGCLQNYWPRDADSRKTDTWADQRQSYVNEFNFQFVFKSQWCYRAQAVVNRGRSRICVQCWVGLSIGISTVIVDVQKVQKKSQSPRKLKSQKPQKPQKSRKR
jgi:hypothetical protein